MPQLSVHLLPSLVDPAALAGASVAVIDVLRATTTMITALDSGAASITVCGEVEQARCLARDSSDAPLLGGERGGVLIAGFHLGNTPADYTPERVRGRRIIFTTTNGTRALLRCQQASRVLVAGFVNLSAVAEKLAAAANVHILCAGTEGHITREDALLAGALVREIRSAQPPSETGWQLNDQAELVLAAWEQLLATDSPPATQLPSQAHLAAELANSRGGRNVVSLAQTADLHTAAELNRTTRVPEFNAEKSVVR